MLGEGWRLAPWWLLGCRGRPEERPWLANTHTGTNSRGDHTAEGGPTNGSAALEGGEHTVAGAPGGWQWYIVSWRGERHMKGGRHL